jgi:hypothetical protein
MALQKTTEMPGYQPDQHFGDKRNAINKLFLVQSKPLIGKPQALFNREIFIA